MFISVCLFLNFASIIQIIEYYAHFTLPRFPITTKWELASWIYAIIILTPFIFFVYNRYFKQEKLQALLEEYSRKSEIRLLIGRCLFFYLLYFYMDWFICNFSIFSSLNYIESIEPLFMIENGV